MLPEVPTVVLSSQDVYQAQSDLRSGAIVAAVSLTEDSALRRERYPHKGLGLPVVLDDYEKLDFEERWRTRRAVVLRLRLIYGPHELAASRSAHPASPSRRADQGSIGAANLLRTRGYVDDLATGVLSALGTRAADGLAVNLGEPQTMPSGGGSSRSCARQSPTSSSSAFASKPCRRTSRSPGRLLSTCSSRSAARKPSWTGRPATPLGGSANR